MGLDSRSSGREILVGKSRVSIGRFTYGIENLRVRQWDEGAQLRIGSFCSIANDVEIFLGGNHRVDWISTFPFGHVYRDELGHACISGAVSTKGDVKIGNDVWIGSRATIMSGIEVGDGAVIAANAVLTKDVAPYCMAAGNPAKIRKVRFNSEIVGLLLRLAWWELPVGDIKVIMTILSSEPRLSTLRELVERYRDESSLLN